MPYDSTLSLYRFGYRIPLICTLLSIKIQQPWTVIEFNSIRDQSYASAQSIYSYIYVSLTSYLPSEINNVKSSGRIDRTLIAQYLLWRSIKYRTTIHVFPFRFGHVFRPWFRRINTVVTLSLLKTTLQNLFRDILRDNTHLQFWHEEIVKLIHFYFL